ncbi:hypothetical protein [Bacillus atrophaeus]|uniref:hypothetical protein n=1 Tax=Bacillus subtilis group TaxID=653685 RepID=UPI0022810CF5|nr:hypothetical protein [Bacillus atrophaeus]MCY8932494.1 hypothetical protein [Bacillus atrophaeus]MCY8940305.1 hypothetical protein [Bacillus atrophaeus]
MPFIKELPEWGNAGQRPPQSSIDEGYKPMDHPPADWFNWYQYTAYHALKELQEIGATQDDVSTALKTAKAYTDEFAARRDNPNQVTKGQVGLGNVDNVQQATKAEFNAHNTDSTRHISSTERSNWNAKETTTGAQNKADTAEKNAKTYTDQHINNKSNPHGVTKDQVGLGNVTNDKQATKTEFDNHVKDTTAHISATERTKWNGAQLFKITNDVGGVLVSIGDTDDFLSKIVKAGKTFGTFYSTGKPTNAPTTLSTRGFFHFTSVDSDGNGTFGYVIAVDYQNNMYTNYVDGNLGWQGWKRLITEADFKKMTWYDLTLINGNKAGGRKPQYAVWGNEVFTRGEVVSPDFNSVFARLPAEARPLTQKSMAATLFGTTGTSKYIAETTGELRLVGKHANIEENISGVSIDNNFTL